MGERIFKTTAALIRSALHDAICDREAMAEAVGPGAERERARQEVAEYKAYLAKRFGERTFTDSLGHGPGIPLAQLICGSDQEFEAPKIDLRIPKGDPTS